MKTGEYVTRHQGGEIIPFIIPFTNQCDNDKVMIEFL